MAHHELKTLPAYFAATKEGIKPFEIRENDRGFQKGDTVSLREWEPRIMSGTYTGNRLERVITYVTGFGQKDGWVVFGHAPATGKEE